MAAKKTEGRKSKGAEPATAKARKRGHKTAQVESNPPAALPERTPEEEALVAAWAEKAMKHRAPKFRAGDRPRHLVADTEDGRLFSARLAMALGTAHPEVIAVLLGQLDGVAWKADTATAVNQAVAVMQDIAPRDTLEGLLAAQMVAVHNTAMEMVRRAMLEDQTVDGVDRAVNRATKLFRTFTAQVGTLMRYRHKGGEQRVVVEHVHIHEGGQAIVGAVSKTGGAGHVKTNGGQPYEPS